MGNEGNPLGAWGHTKNPGRVRGSRYIPDRRKLPASSKNDIHEGCRTGRECSELKPHGVLVVRTFGGERFGES